MKVFFDTEFTGLNHVHVLFKAHPNTELSKFINAYKSASSRLIKKEFPDVRKKTMERVFLVSELLLDLYR